MDEDQRKGGAERRRRTAPKAPTKADAVEAWARSHPHGDAAACERATGASLGHVYKTARERGIRFRKTHPEAKDTVKARIASWARANPGSWSWQAAEFAGTSTGYARAVAAELGLPVRDPAVGNPCEGEEGR